MLICDVSERENSRVVYGKNNNSRNKVQQIFFITPSHPHLVTNSQILYLSESGWGEPERVLLFIPPTTNNYRNYTTDARNGWTEVGGAVRNSRTMMMVFALPKSFFDYVTIFLTESAKGWSKKRKGRRIVASAGQMEGRTFIIHNYL